jgi:ADP-heptose:LPS heptosyltransferase
MPPSKYRYRTVHALCERVLATLSEVLPDAPRPGLSAPARRVLVLKFGGLGEAVLARSLVEHLRRRNHCMRIDFIVEPRTVEVMTCATESFARVYNPQSDGLGRALATLREVRARRYDAVVDFEQTSVLTAAFMRLARVPIRIGLVPPIPSPRLRFLTHPVKLREDEAMWRAFIRLGRVLDQDLPEDVTTVPLNCSPDTRRWADQWWGKNIGFQAASRVVAFHLGVGPRAEYRRWPVARFAELAARLRLHTPDVRVVMTGDSSEQFLYAEFARCFTGNIVPALDLGGIERTAALLQRCDLLVSADTGVMHLGAAMGTPTVGLFGPNTPACWAPVGPRATYVYPTRQPCSPCINSYIRRLPANCTASVKSACMWDIAVDDVLEAARRVVRDTWLC